MDFFDSNLFNWIILPLLIFFARIIDVTIGTLRIVFISRGFKKLTPIVGFFEIMIWLAAVRAIMSNLDNIITFFAFCAGFAAGNYIGMIIEEKLSIGLISIRIVTQNNAESLVNALREENYGVTIVEATGRNGKVNLVYTIINRKHLKKVAKLINNFNPNAFYSIEEVRYVNEGIFPLNKMKNVEERKFIFKMLRPFAKRK